ncbi:MAG TPA: serine/threonine-protein kinase [Candidatus Sulfotelmatobacter sp.]|nr:serine/threonine-protein kinase [Candidatus Sulfotelmatobacter sp.]
MSDRWTRVTDIFSRALAEAPEARDAFLSRECAGDPALEAEVRSLLQHHQQTGDFLEPSRARLEAFAAAQAAPPAATVAGEVLGAWRLVRPIGEGGMGLVWLVERTGGQFAQRGALKLIRIGLASEEMIRRFRRERQILASLDHPHIARLLDGGSSPDGLPYLVMEYVEGEPLYTYCSSRTLSIAQRLRLFLTLCSAVQYAHQKLVVHRDLKPGNVMVTADGVPKLLDFGVAKIFDEELEASGELRTVELPFTPLYASPEQLRGEPATTSSDLYSMGVLLFELLTGMHPYPTRGGGAAEVIRTVLGTDPPRPSAAVTATRAASASPLPPPPLADGDALRRRLAGDLDNIVLKAISKDPARRYASIERLADDVKRYLDGRPVEARPDSWSYRAGKFVGRNRLAVVAGTLAILALVAGLAISLREAAVARHARALAEHRLRDVQSLANTLMFDVYDGIENMPGATAVRLKVIEKTAGYLDALAAEAGPDSSVRFSLADAYERLGIVRAATGGGVASNNLAARRGFERSRDLREGLLAQYPDNERALTGLVQVYTRLGAIDEVLSQFPEALALMRRAAECGERLVKLHPDNHAYVAGLPRRYNNLGNALLYNHKPAEAMVELRRAIDLYAALAAADTSDWQQRRLMAMSLTVYGDCLTSQPGEAVGADSIERRALALYSELYRRRPEDLDLAERTADGHERLSEISIMRMHQLDSALVHVEIAQRMIEEVQARDPSNRDFDVDVAEGLAMQGFILAAGGRREAEAILAKARSRLESLVREDSTDSRLISSLPELYLGLGTTAQNRARGAGAGASAGYWREARSAYQQARESNQRLETIEGGPIPLSSDVYAWITNGLAACDSALGGSRRH